jgi:hypothetical protein
MLGTSMAFGETVEPAAVTIHDGIGDSDHVVDVEHA